MPVSQKQKSARGIPRKTRNPARKQRHKRYWDRATCIACSLVFSAPWRKKRHADSDHHDCRGLRKSHTGVQQMAMDAIQQRLKGQIFGE